MQSDVIENGELKIENRYLTDLITEHALEDLDRYAREGREKNENSFCGGITRR